MCKHVVALFVAWMLSLEFVGSVLDVSSCMSDLAMVQSHSRVEVVLFDEYRVGESFVYALLLLKCIILCICMFI